MAIFEKRPGAPSGNITVNTASGQYVFTDGGSVTTTDRDDINTFLAHPFIRLQAGGGGPFVPPPVVESVYLKDGVLVKATDQSPVVGPGATGPAGVNWRNPPLWSGANAYVKNDGVIWLGSSFVALNNIAAGGSNPFTDTVNWAIIAQGGGELAYSEYTGVDIAVSTSTPADIPGVVLSVPAGSPASLLRATGYARAAATAANTFAQVQLIVYDIDAGAALKSGIVQMNMSVSGMSARSPIVVEVRLPSSPTARNFKLQQFALLGASVTAFINGPGTTAVNQAVALSAVAR